MVRMNNIHVNGDNISMNCFIEGSKNDIPDFSFTFNIKSRSIVSEIDENYKYFAHKAMWHIIRFVRDNNKIPSSSCAIWY